MQVLMSPELTLAQYAAVLQRLHACFAALAPSLNSFLQRQTEAVPWLDARIYERRADLESDLLVLGYGSKPEPATTCTILATGRHNRPGTR
jgi:hypothetical protein